VTNRRGYPIETPAEMPCDGCGASIPAGARAFFRVDGAVFCETSCETAHPEALPPLTILAVSRRQEATL